MPTVRVGVGGFKMAPTLPTNTQEQTESRNSNVETVNTRMPASRLVTATLKDTSKTVRQMDAFCMQMARDAAPGNVKNESQVRNGTLLIETQKDKEEELLLKANLIGCYPVQAK